MVLVQLAALAFVLLFCLSFHEYAHAWAAKKQGDDTAYIHGRLTLDPMKHLDPIGSLMILLAGVGYAKPVPVNPRNFHSYKRGMALTSLAGPLSNLIVAFFFSLFHNIAWYVFTVKSPEALYSTELTLPRMLTTFLGAVFTANVGLAVFNLLPIPPLDGSRLLDLVLPAKASMFLAHYERYISMAFLALLLLGALSVPIGYLSGKLIRGIHFVTGFPFRYLR